MSQLKVDSIIPTTGAPTSGGGGIVQVVQNSDTTTTGILDLGSGNAFASIPNLNVTITPRSASSKVLISFQAWGEGDAEDHKYSLRVQRAISGGATTNIMDYVAIATEGNALDFGDLTQQRYSAAAMSNCHGGL